MESFIFTSMDQLLATAKDWKLEHPGGIVLSCDSKDAIGWSLIPKQLPDEDTATYLDRNFSLMIKHENFAKWVESAGASDIVDLKAKIACCLSGLK